MENKKTITIHRTFDLPLGIVWKAFSESETMKKWYSPEDYSVPDCTVDFRVGGKYLFSMKSPDGKKTWSTGTFEEIEPKKKIVYSDSFSDENGNIVPASHYGMPGNWEPQLTITILLEGEEGQTKMTMTHEDLPIEMADDCEEGWQSCFDKLEKNID